MVVEILKLSCILLTHVFGSAKTLTSPTSSSAFYKVPLPCPQEFSILNSKNKRREENRAEQKNISFLKSTLVLCFIIFVSSCKQLLLQQ